jgi:hypothetical protein
MRIAGVIPTWLQTSGGETMTSTYRMTGVALTLATALSGVSVTQAAVDNQRVWDGFVTITSATAQCAAVPGAAIGNTHVSVYRPKIAAADPPSFLSLLGLRSAVTMQNTAEGIYPQFQGPSTYAAVAVTDRAKSLKYNGNTSFSIAPFTVVANTAAVTITGTIGSFFKTSGCTIGIEGAYARRPD